MDGSKALRPIIIKKKKVIAGGGHHGGAWKVAYADFVTAMMAFFMLMWLLNATTEQQRKGLADYFTPTVPVARISGGGVGSFGGDSPFSEEDLAQSGTGATSENPTEGRQAMGALGTGNSAALEQAVLEEIEDSLQGMGDSRISDQALEHVQTRLTDQGLVIEIFARPGAPLFTDEDTLQPWLVAFSRVMAELFDTVTNSVAIGAYVRAEPIVIARETIWDRSTAQAHILRQQLQEAGLDAQRFRRVTGHADRSPATSDPMAVRNDRLEIVLLRTGQ
ncbi:flagellar motor protein MotB [Alterinioella nitratireducens]|jgi:chemotaxis protein MotB|uniref:flagellar motor protein MotB n=1 Tax=Alterinioella nitratireducens TaxID=2735915 RepID=UPI0015551404|nr:flagellar motor protein MotB [Alterinioella nitratireducens]NPD20174.1 chemotaxis protein MotB [Alterinioella nitratireducens]